MPAAQRRKHKTEIQNCQRLKTLSCVVFSNRTSISQIEKRTHTWAMDEATTMDVFQILQWSFGRLFHSLNFISF